MGLGGGLSNSRAPSLILRAAKLQTAKLGSPGGHPSSDPLPERDAPFRRAPTPFGAVLTFPSSRGPTGEQGLDPATCKAPGAHRVASGRAARPIRAGATVAAAPDSLWAPPRRSQERTRGRSQAPPHPLPGGAPRAPEGSGCPGCGLCWARGPGGWPGRGADACAAGSPAQLALPGPPPTPRPPPPPPPPPAPAAPSPAAPPLRSSRLPGSSRLFSLPGGGGGERSGAGGGAARAEGGGGRGRGEGGGERQAAPPPGCRRSPISRSLKLDPESGARDCITDYIRLYRASRSHIRGGARAGGGLGGGERDHGEGVRRSGERT